MTVKKDKTKLESEKRKVLGRKVKQLRREGTLPANVYGKKVKSLAIQLKIKDFIPVYDSVGETGVVNLKLKSETKYISLIQHPIF